MGTFILWILFKAEISSHFLEMFQTSIECVSETQNIHVAAVSSGRPPIPLLQNHGNTCATGNEPPMVFSRRVSLRQLRGSCGRFFLLFFQTKINQNVDHARRNTPQHLCLYNSFKEWPGASRVDQYKPFHAVYICYFERSESPFYTAANSIAAPY